MDRPEINIHSFGLLLFPREARKKQQIRIVACIGVAGRQRT